MRRAKVVSPRWAGLLAGPLVVGFAISGCGGPKQEGKVAAGARSQVRIGVSLLTRTHPFYQRGGVAAKHGVMS
jgi:hypothetical protein